jgi:hypothetical protein
VDGEALTVTVLPKVRLAEDPAKAMVLETLFIVMPPVA